MHRAGLKYDYLIYLAETLVMESGLLEKDGARCVPDQPIDTDSFYVWRTIGKEYLGPQLYHAND